MLISILIFIVLLVGWMYWLIGKGNALFRAKAEYEQALRADDKSLALQLGRRYYSLKNGGFLSSYDEAAIANDLSTMK